MQITKEYIEAKIIELQGELQKAQNATQQAVQTSMAISGAIEMQKQNLAYLEQESEQEQENG